MPVSDIVLSAATRSSLLAAQNTTSLLATTQSRLSTGKAVNSALDNPLNFFTASNLNSRAGDLNTLLDGVSNGIQTIQAASTGITNIQKLVDSAKSTASQALSTQITTTGTATSAFTASATTVAFTVNGVSKSATLTAAMTIDDAIGVLNTAAGSNSFGKDSGGTKITVNGSGAIKFATAEGAKIGLAAVGASGASTSYYDATTNSTDLTVNGLKARSDLATQYNALLTQMDQLANDSSYNGVNLVNSSGTSNKLHIQFNSNDTSNIDVQGVDASSTGIGLSSIALTAAGSFTTDTAINSALTKLTTATNNLRGYSSTLGSSLSVVQNRQDFTKNLINVLQTGSSNLTDADLNQEAANSQALSTRQSLAISAISLANQAQQSVLQLLR